MADSFRFKQFTVSNERSAQKVGTDGVLLGAWVGLSGAEQHILDVGTGTGVIALMMAQRCPAIVVGIDIDAPSAEEASANFNASPWGSRMAAFRGDFRGLGTATAHPLVFLRCPYDLIISNPPFFNDSLKAPDERRSDARHSDTLSFGELAAEAAQLLSPEGRLAVIYPVEEAEKLAGEALVAGLFPCRICRVHTKKGTPAKRVMMEFSRQKKEPLIEELHIMEAGEFTREYRSLTGDFYIKF